MRLAKTGARGAAADGGSAPRPNRAGDAANHDGGGMIRKQLRGSSLTEVSISDYGRLGGGLLQIQGRRRQGDKATACG